MTERPVEEQVELRQEHVTIERRPVDRELAPGEVAFQERTIEAVERGEEAVVAKTARVTEEIGIRKDVERETETVRDTVRKQEIEVEDERTTRDSRGTRANQGGAVVTDREEGSPPRRARATARRPADTLAGQGRPAARLPHRKHGMAPSCQT